jgi:BirA family biotin operon repressor/biotin-[acetyl-CoA-carboxylase] ligase
MTGDFDVAGVERELAARAASFGLPLRFMNTTGSTNDDAKRAAREGMAGGAAFAADEQTQGRGRLGRTWYSPPGANLYASFVVRPAFDLKTAPLVTLAAGLAVIDAIAETAGDGGLSLKWPNDIWLRGRKVAGILCEAQLADGESAAPDAIGARRAGWIVVGIGINVHGTSFPEELRARATSLSLEGARVARGALFVALAASLGRRIEMLRSGHAAIVEAAAARDALLGRAVTIDGAPAIALGIAKNGSLKVRRPDGVESACIAGEVALSVLDGPNPCRVP